MKITAKRVLVEGLGWILVVVGIAALILPGPGLLALFAGVALLAHQYDWAERRLAPIRKRALDAAADSVKTWPRLTLSTVGVLWLIGLGVAWALQPDVPAWWPLGDWWWLPGGMTTGITLAASGVIAGAMLVYSYLNFRDIKDDQHSEDEASAATS